jgi:hypothetical protein
MGVLLMLSESRVKFLDSRLLCIYCCTLHVNQLEIVIPFHLHNMMSDPETCHLVFCMVVSACVFL